MNVRRITDNFSDTLLTLSKIYAEYQFEPVSSKLSGLGESVTSLELKDPELEFISAFENGAEIGVLVTKNNEICALSIKKYAQKRGVGKALLDYYLKDLQEGESVSVKIEPEFTHFYESLGFKTLESDGQAEDYILMIYRKE